jgi:DnaK suppressor protein
MPEEIKEILFKMKEEIIDEIREKIKSDSKKDSKEDVGDIYDLASIERDRELDLLISDRDKEKLEEIEDALDRIDDGTYGVCEKCGAKIPKERLKIMPFALFCVSCKSELEKAKNLERGFKGEREYRKLAFTSSEEEESS